MDKKEKEYMIADERLRSVAIIMDGNGRWAKRRLLPRTKGHEKGAANIEKVLGYLRDAGIKYVTLYAFSTENWKRPKYEVDALMNIAMKYCDKKFLTKVQDEKDLTIKFIGDKSGLPEKLREKCIEIENMQKETTYVCNIAFNYGGRNEIAHAADCVMKARLPMTEENISKFLYTAGTPDPDMIIRTAGEFRTSNFLLWQSAYSEYVITDTLWPDFDRDTLDECIREFYSRKRRFGGLDKEETT